MAREFNLTDTDIQNLLDAHYVGNTVTLEDGTVLEYITDELFVEEFRWAYVNMSVFEVEGELYGFKYEVPSTELQDMQDEWSYIEPELVPVHEERRIVYVES